LSCQTFFSIFYPSLANSDPRALNKKFSHRADAEAGLLYLHTHRYSRYDPNSSDHAGGSAARTGYHFVLVQDSLEGPLCPLVLIAVTS